MDESKYKFAVDFVAGWTEELKGIGYTRYDALNYLHRILRLGGLEEIRKGAGEIKADIDRVIRERLERGKRLN